MYTLGSTEFNQIIETPNNQSIKKRLVLLDDNTIIDKIKSLILYSSSSSQELQLGTTNMAYIEAEVDSDLLLTNREVRLECGVTLSDGSEEYIPMGVFTIQKPQGDIDFVKFKAHDNMQKFEKLYSSVLDYPTTSNLVLDEICNMCGVALSTPIENPIEITEKLQGYTCREVLGFIAGIHGKFACIDRLGTLNLRWYSETPIDKQIGLIWAFNKSDDDFTVDKIEIAKDTETNYTSGSGFSAIYHSNPLATQEIADVLFAKLNGFTYNASTIDILDDIRLDIWDVIKVIYLDGKEYLVPCMSLKQDFGQGSTSIQSFAKTNTENEYRYTGATTNYINRVAMELLLTNRIVATKVDAEYVNSVAITTENFEAKVAEIKELVVEEIDGKYATIDFANIDVANINKTNIGLLFAEVGLLDRATIVDGHVTGFLDAVEINANKITAGTLIADRILLSGGENGVLYALNNLGELTSTNVDTLDGYILTDRTITADKIIANSITTNELDVDKIFGNEAVLNKIVSQDIFSNAVATNRVVVGKANKDDVVVDNLFPYPYQKYYNLQGNVEWFVDEDGIVTTSGTSNAASALYISTDFTLEPGTYTVSGCPSGGSSSTYRIQMANSDWSVHINDFGDGATFTLTEKTTFTTIRCYIASGVNTNGLVFKPMLVKGTEIFPFYPHRLSTQGLIEQMKVDNLFDVNLRCSKTINGVTGTVKENGNALLNGTISANGTAMTVGTSTYINISDLEIGESITISVRILSGIYNQATSSTASFYFDVRTADGTNLTDAAIKGGTVLHLTNHYGKVTYTMTQERKDAGAYYIYPQIWAYKNDVFGNLEMQVMIEKGDIAHWYTEYSKGGTGIANNLYREGTTLIDGNKIYTGSILADSIDINDLFADTAFIDALRTNSIIVGIGNKADTALSEVNKTVKSITMHYLATTASSGVTTSTSGWTTTVQQIDATKKYLWTYQTITYADNTTTDTSPVISGVYGNEGTNGVGITSVTPLYYLKSNTTAPSTPTSAVTSTSTGSGVWTTAIPKYVSGYTYFTCTQTQYTDGTYKWSTVVADNALTNANKTANTANTNASNAVTTANTANTTANTANSTATTANNTANAIKNNIYKSGTTLIDGGKIFTGTVTADAIDVDDLFAENINMTGKFISTGKAQLAPGIEEMNTISKFIKGEITLTNAQKTLYDFNKDGTVNIADFMLAKSCALGRRTIESLVSDFGYVIPQSDIQTIINSSNPQKVISISATNSWGRQIEAYFGLDGLSVPKVETNSIKAFGIEVEDEIDAVGDVYANYGTDTQVSLLGLQEKVNYLQPHGYSLIRYTDIGELTTTQKIYTLFNNRKMSDYGMLLITIGVSATDIRETMYVPTLVFSGSDSLPRTLYLECWTDNGATFNQVRIDYVSDTQIKAYLVTSTTKTKYLNIYGVKVDAGLSGRSVDLI